MDLGLKSSSVSEPEIRHNVAFILVTEIMALFSEKIKAVMEISRDDKSALWYLLFWCNY